MRATTTGEHLRTWLCERCPTGYLTCPIWSSVHAITMPKDMAECATVSGDMATCERRERGLSIRMRSGCGRQPRLKTWAHTSTAVCTRGAKGGRPVVHPAYAKRGRRHSHRGERAVRSRDDHVGTWLYTSEDETTFMQQLGLGTRLSGARCPVFSAAVCARGARSGHSEAI